MRRAVLQGRGEVDLACDIGGGREGLGDGDVRSGLVVRVVVVVIAATVQRGGGGELRCQGGVDVSSGTAGLVGGGRPSLWFGGLGLESVEGKEAQIWET